MTYDFDRHIDRHNTCSYKWDSAPAPDILPMWVADMDFATAPAVIEALRRQVDIGIFGYTRVPQSYYDAVVGWMQRRHGWTIDPASIIYTSGVVPAISAVIKALARPGQKVIVQTPVYNCFFSSIRNNGCIIADNPLIADGDTYRMDLDGLARIAADPDVRLMLLCNPHNPAGRVWTRDELRAVADICLANSVTVISDEIHGELAFPGHPYTPFASLGPDCRDNSVVCFSPSKAFNIAGLQIASIVATDPAVRAAIDRAININEVCDVNPFGVVATIAAYNHGADWLDALVAYIRGNYDTFRAYCAANLPQFPLTKLEGTYLVWMDCRALGLDSDTLERELIDHARLWLNAGTMYGPGGQGFMRWNIACPRDVMLDGLDRFTRFVNNHSATHRP